MVHPRGLSRGFEELSILARPGLDLELILGSLLEGGLGASNGPVWGVDFGTVFGGFVAAVSGALEEGFTSIKYT